MLVHCNIMNISLFSTQIFTRNRTIQDVCTERNKFKKNSTFTIVRSWHSSSQKFILPHLINIATLIHICLSYISDDTLCFFSLLYAIESYYTKTLMLARCFLLYMLKTNTYRCIFIIRIGNRILHFLNQFRNAWLNTRYDLLIPLKPLYSISMLYSCIFDQILCIIAFFLWIMVIDLINNYAAKLPCTASRFDLLLVFLIHFCSRCSVQTFTTEQHFLAIRSWINSFRCLESCTNIVLQKKLENGTSFIIQTQRRSEIN